MGSNLFVIGLSWRTAPVAVREKLAFGDDELPAVLSELTALPYVGEAMLISTCNRVEIYAATDRSAPASALDVAAAEVRSYLSRARRVSAEELAENLYEHADTGAVRHAFSVASALDSLVVGEAQILGQLKAAYGVAASTGTTGPMLGRCMERAFGVAKRVRTETAISRGAANVSSVAVELAQHVFTDLSGKTVLVVGAGKMSALAVRHLRTAGAGTILVTNRSPEKAEALADEVDGVARAWNQLESLLGIADVVISSTGAREPVLTKKLFKKVMRQRRYEPMVVIDIAVPRDAEPVIGDLDGVYLFDIDDLQRVVTTNLKERAKEAEFAAAIVDGEVVQFERWMSSQRVVPTIRALREHFSQVAEAEVERALKGMASADSDDKRDQAVRRLGNLIVNKLLHHPMTVLKQGDDEALVTAVHRLFDLPGEDPEDGTAPALKSSAQQVGQGSKPGGGA
ncbi:glutamyl-tRNA reductase [Haliangium sp.]|uniref:glutamyl-tRNA reductase n=1 Tax=Haliangium sp. TaxID=2663208 RepID=UPI003D10D328